MVFRIVHRYSAKSFQQLVLDIKKVYFDVIEEYEKQVKNKEVNLKEENFI